MSHPNYPTTANTPISDWLTLSPDAAKADAAKLDTAIETTSMIFAPEDVRFATVATFTDMRRGEDYLGILSLCVFSDDQMAISYLEDIGPDEPSSPDHVMIWGLRFNAVAFEPEWDATGFDRKLKLVLLSINKSGPDFYMIRLGVAPNDGGTNTDASTRWPAWEAVRFLKSKVAPASN